MGTRPGEKLDEELITVQESFNCYDMGKYYGILSNKDINLHKYYKKKYKIVKNKISYTSGNNNKFLNVKDLKKIIKDYSKKNNVWEKYSL